MGMGRLLQDLRYGFRTLAKNPGFAAIAILTLALGTGANTALFSVVNGVLLNPLPFPQPDQLVTLHESKPNFETGAIPYLNFADWQTGNHTFSSVAISRGYAFSLTGIGEAERLQGDWVSAGFFSTLGITPVLGRDFTPRDDQFGAGPVALISASLWTRKFGAARDVVGESITLDGKDYTIIGVMPATLDLRASSFRAGDVYAPICQWNNPALRNRMAALGLHGIGRMKPGVTLDQAKGDLQAIARNLAAAYPDANRGTTANVLPLKQSLVGKVQPFLLVLLGAVGFVLLIACVNVANLLLARSTGRSREFAIRAALGAGQGRVIRQLLTESVLLGLAGGGLGLLLASWGTRAALGALPAALPRAEEIGLDGRVLIFTVIISLLAGFGFGLAPALRASRPDLHETLKESGRGASGARHRAQGVFVAVEIAMALVLLVGAGLMIRTLGRLWSVDPGFDAQKVLRFAFAFSPSVSSASAAAIRADWRELDRRLGSIPGVEAVSISWGAFPMSDEDDEQFWLEGQPKPQSASEMHWALEYTIEPDYLKAMKIPLIRGRFFTPQDTERSPLVIVVDDIFARKYFPNQDAIGKRINLNGYGQLAEIVGVVGHVNQWGLDSDEANPLRAEIYHSFRQLPDPAMAPSATGVAVVMRSGENPDALTRTVRRVTGEMNHESLVYGVQTMEEILVDSLAGRRFSMILLSAFAALAVLLASVGIYGVISYLVGQRTHEIGVRMALGAERGDVMRLVLGQGTRLTLTGVGAGLLAALGLTRLLTKYSLLFGVSATDPVTFGAVAMLLVLVSLAACYLPARRAMKVDPMVALRYE
ncbi:MAG TPA: ABC transporter permease [Terriglobia bacterium]